jgi:hypothetical protein
VSKCRRGEVGHAHAILGEDEAQLLGHVGVIGGQELLGAELRRGSMEGISGWGPMGWSFWEPSCGGVPWRVSVGGVPWGGASGSRAAEGGIDPSASG